MERRQLDASARRIHSFAPSTELATGHRSDTVRPAAGATDQAVGTNLVRYITLIAVIGILILQWSGSIPLASVGGSLVIATAYFTAAAAVGVHEAWAQRRGVIGWIVNIIVVFVGTFLAAQLGGLVMVMLLSLVANLDGSLAKTGGPVMSIALVGGMIATILGSWGALRIVSRWR